MAYKFICDGIFHKYKVQTLALLLSIADLGDEGTKRQVLNNIKTKKYLKKYDLSYTKCATEPRWENQIAWIVSDLKEDEYMDKHAPHGIWRTTSVGRQNLVGGILHCLEELEAGNRVDELSSNWYRAALEYIFFVFERANKPLPSFITPELIEKIDKMTDSQEEAI